MILRTALILGLAFAGSAQAQNDPAIAAQRASVMLQNAADALAAAEGAQDRVSALTETVRAYEDGLFAVREGLRRVSREERRLSAELAAQRDQLAELLAVLQRIERAPEPILLLHPSGPLGTARSGMIIADVTPALAAEARAVRAQLQDLATMRQMQDSAQNDLAEGLIGIQAARTALSQAMAERVDLPAPLAEDAEQMRGLLAATDTLDGFAAALRAEAEAQPIPPRSVRLSERRGALDLPVRGRVLRGFEQADAAGIARPGLILATAPRALVTAPFSGTIRYSGPLLDFGNVVLLETDPEHLIVLAGLSEVFRAQGEVVETGDPLGLMGGAEASSENLIVTNAQVSGTSLSETLYIELREGDTPVDPEDWFRTDRDEE